MALFFTSKMVDAVLSARDFDMMFPRIGTGPTIATHRRLLSDLQRTSRNGLIRNLRAGDGYAMP
jgi:hypothetical protein